jgi:flagellar protein FlbD
MVKVTRLDGMDFVLNAELIEHIEATPDSVITLTTGKKWVVLEPVDEIVRRVVQYRRSLRPYLTPVEVTE